jgi:hypothetical protein
MTLLKKLIILIPCDVCKLLCQEAFSRAHHSAHPFIDGFPNWCQRRHLPLSEINNGAQMNKILKQHIPTTKMASKTLFDSTLGWTVNLSNDFL